MLLILIAPVVWVLTGQDAETWAGQTRTAERGTSLLLLLGSNPTWFATTTDAETWTEHTKQAETWTERSKQSEAWVEA